MKTLKAIHRIVALELAKGGKLPDICEAYELSLLSWRQTVSQPLFKNAVADFQREIVDEEIEKHVNDPVRERILGARLSSVDTLITERDSVETEYGASAATRIKAAEKILELAGDFKKEEEKTNVVIIKLSRETLEGVKRDQSSFDCIDVDNYVVESA